MASNYVLIDILCFMPRFWACCPSWRSFFISLPSLWLFSSADIVSHFSDFHFVVLLQVRPEQAIWQCPTCFCFQFHLYCMKAWVNEALQKIQLKELSSGTNVPTKDKNWHWCAFFFFCLFVCLFVCLRRVTDAVLVQSELQNPIYVCGGSAVLFLLLWKVKRSSSESLAGCALLRWDLREVVGVSAAPVYETVSRRSLWALCAAVDCYVLLRHRIASCTLKNYVCFLFVFAFWWRKNFWHAKTWLVIRALSSFFSAETWRPIFLIYFHFSLKKNEFKEKHLNFLKKKILLLFYFIFLFFYFFIFLTTKSWLFFFFFFFFCRCSADVRIASFRAAAFATSNWRAKCTSVKNSATMVSVVPVVSNPCNLVAAGS